MSSLHILQEVQPRPARCLRRLPVEGHAPRFPPRRKGKCRAHQQGRGCSTAEARRVRTKDRSLSLGRTIAVNVGTHPRPRGVAGGTHPAAVSRTLFSTGMYVAGPGTEHSRCTEVPASRLQGAAAGAPHVCLSSGTRPRPSGSVPPSSPAPGASPSLLVQHGCSGPRQAGPARWLLAGPSRSAMGRLGPEIEVTQLRSNPNPHF